MGYNFNTKTMKKILLLLACAGLFGVSCSKKTTPKTEDVEIIVPCSGPEYMTNDKYLRASAMGLAGEINMAKKKAMAEASAQLASSMNQLVERVAVNYANSYQVGENEDGSQKFEDMAKIVPSTGWPAPISISSTSSETSSSAPSASRPSTWASPSAATSCSRRGRPTMWCWT